MARCPSPSARRPAPGSEAARQAGAANAARQADLTTWGVYLQARAQGDTALARYVEQRFTDHFRVAYGLGLLKVSRRGSVQDEGVCPTWNDGGAAADQRADRPASLMHS